MKSLNKIACYCLVIVAANIALNANALDQMAKEEITPPPAEGALTTEQLPPLFSSTDKEKTQTMVNTAASKSIPIAEG
jgi:hypothetical protein